MIKYWFIYWLYFSYQFCCLATVEFMFKDGGFFLWMRRMVNRYVGIRVESKSLFYLWYFLFSKERITDTNRYEKKNCSKIFSSKQYVIHVFYKNIGSWLFWKKVFIMLKKISDNKNDILEPKIWRKKLEEIERFLSNLKLAYLMCSKNFLVFLGKSYSNCSYKLNSYKKTYILYCHKIFLLFYTFPNNWIYYRFFAHV